jgi:predicted TIM-barrel fold metal-dependent hydrolase
VIVDAHTHAFPPDLIRRRAELSRREPTFAQLYADPRAKLATADEVVSATERAGIDRAVIAGFAWNDPALCREHNDYLLRAARQSAGRLIPFCTLPLAHPAAARREATLAASDGARGFGELRPESQGRSIAEDEVSDLLSWAWKSTGLPLLIHASEPVGHGYPGKAGQPLESLYKFICRLSEVRVIAAHWGGGLPFYALMPEVRAALANVWVDTAATTLLYEPAIFRVVVDLIGAEKVLFASDYPLLSHRSQLKAVEAAPLTESERPGVIGGNAASLLNLYG